MQKIRVGIVGYGNIGRGVEAAISAAEDMELVAVFTRRDPKSVTTRSGAKLVHMDEIASYRGAVDVMVLCGGSATDLPVQGPQIAALFNTVDSFDTHAKIPEYLQSVDAAARQAGTLSIVSVGWDPGLFSIMRAIGGSVLPDGNDYTFWGRGVSQGHSDAIRRVEGVKNAIQYTVPIEQACERVRAGENPALTTRQKHVRECYVVAQEGADRARIEHDIVTMPNYFADYDTTVHFITEQELHEKHSRMPHGGFVFRTGKTGFTGEENRHVIEYALKLDSNPEFTGSILAAYARAAVRLSREGVSGGKTVFDIPLTALSPLGRDELIKNLL
ncbi:diaminopimelate dehydrogenase [Feifania hominis]|uniref:Meso-diaminopimelate D-dehydrogenase n=1 Tax=Feifania hominis TaxID=2763660 RepID=A0A926DA98_9FIRM|nr:diaminopimelate dehydrogenase [Feifania hominis]MBC8535285.1 diaminopimelate dehydrogenase [Feifania hominis]